MRLQEIGVGLFGPPVIPRARHMLRTSAVTYRHEVDVFAADTDYARYAGISPCGLTKLREAR